MISPKKVPNNDAKEEKESNEQKYRSKQLGTIQPKKPEKKCRGENEIRNRKS